MRYVTNVLRGNVYGAMDGLITQLLDAGFTYMLEDRPVKDITSKEILEQFPYNESAVMVDLVSEEFEVWIIAGSNIPLPMQYHKLWDKFSFTIPVQFAYMIDKKLLKEFPGIVCGLIGATLEPEKKLLDVIADGLEANDRSPQFEFAKREYDTFKMWLDVRNLEMPEKPKPTQMGKIKAKLVKWLGPIFE